MLTAGYVDRILKVENPAEYELVINRSAKPLGLAVWVAAVTTILKIFHSALGANMLDPER